MAKRRASSEGAAPAAASATAADGRIMGSEDHTRIFETTRYVWSHRRQRSDIEDDRKFATKRMALLYCAKMNSDSFCEYLAEVGKEWINTCRPGGSQKSVEPNRPFDIDFLELSDDMLDAYGSGVAQAFAVVKAPQGTVYQWAPRVILTTSVDELSELLARPRQASTGTGT